VRRENRPATAAAPVSDVSLALLIFAETGQLSNPPIGGARYSHSIVAGGFEERSKATRLTPGISLMIRPASASSRS
jgi:hypothetical protein